MGNYAASIKAGEDVDDSEVADMTDVKAGARGIWEHLGEIFFRFRITIWEFLIDGASLKSLGLSPDFLPFLFDFQWVISIHGVYYNIG